MLPLLLMSLNTLAHEEDTVEDRGRLAPHEVAPILRLVVLTSKRAKRRREEFEELEFEEERPQTARPSARTGHCTLATFPQIATYRGVAISCAVAMSCLVTERYAMGGSFLLQPRGGVLLRSAWHNSIAGLCGTVLLHRPIIFCDSDSGSYP